MPLTDQAQVAALNVAVSQHCTTGGFGGAGVAQAGGFLGLLQDQLQIRNQEENVARLQ